MIVALLVLIVVYAYHHLSLDLLEIFFPGKGRKIPVAILMSLIILVMTYYRRVSDWNDFYFLLAQVLITSLVFRLELKVNILQLIFIGLIIKFFVFGIQGITMLVIANYFEVSILNLVADSTLYMSTIFISRLLLVIIQLRVKNHIFVPVKNRNLSFTNKELLKVVLGELIFCIILILLKSEYKSFDRPIHFILIFFFVLVCNYIFLKLYFEYTLRKTSYEKKQLVADELETQLKKQKNHYLTLKGEIEAYKKMNHDYHSILRVLDHLLKNEGKDQQMRLINEFVDEMKILTGQTKFFSNNLILDAILHDAWMVCQENHIHFDACVYMDERMVVSDLDLIRISNNLLSNAIEANLKVGQKDRFIEIKTQIVNDWAVFEISNAYHGRLSLKGGRLLSSKKNKKNHGYGLQIAKELVTKNGGILSTDINKSNQSFTVKIVQKVDWISE